MKKTLKRTLSLVLATLILASVACVSVSANSGAKVNNNINDIITDTTDTNTYYFYMPDSWKNEYNDNYSESDPVYSAGIYWWEGTSNCEDNPNAESNGWPGYNVTDTVADNVYVAHVPTDVTTIIWNNSVNGGEDQDADVYTAAIQSVNIGSEYFVAGDADDEYGFFPEGVESFNEMIYVCDPDQISINEYSGKATYKGSWLYYYGDGKYGTYATLAEAEANDAVYSGGEFPSYGFKIDNETLDVPLYGSELEYTITPNKSSATATVADESVATITQDETTGVVTVTPVAVGTTTVDFTYTEDGVVSNASCTVTVYEPTTEIYLNKTSTSLYVKKTYTIKEGTVYDIDYPYGTTTFKSSNTKVATVNSNGKITAKKKGTATITIKNNGATAKFKVTVKNPKLNKTSVTLKKGKTTTLKVTGSTGKVTYKSNKTKVATVNNKGKVKAKKKGTATITVTASGVKLKCKVKVK